MLKMSADSCTGINLGDCAYHQALSKLYPDTVAYFVDLQAQGRTVNIGGVQEQGQAVTITHVIAYWMPFSFKGAHAKVAFGLAESIAATALVGIGFLRATNAIMHFSSEEPEIFLQALNANLRIFYEPPTVREPPRSVDSTAVYTAVEKEDTYDHSYYNREGDEVETSIDNE